jgi:hypothetical protein
MGNGDWTFKATIATVLALWVGSFAYSILNPVHGKDALTAISVAAPGLIGALFGFRTKGGSGA